MRPDPVCGAVLDVRQATAVSRHRERYYYFCSLRCRDAFELAPERFVPALQATRRRVHTAGRRHSTVSGEEERHDHRTDRWQSHE